MTFQKSKYRSGKPTPEVGEAANKDDAYYTIKRREESVSKIAREPTQMAVDGHTLPSLVQVTSSGKRYHITLRAYNKVCIVRREKLQQIQDGEKTKRQSTEENTVVTEIQPSNAQCAMLGNGGSLVQNIARDEKSQDKK